MLDLFCGGGGSSLGAQRAGAIPIAALDMWKVAADTYKLNFPNSSVYNMKAESMPPLNLVDKVGPIDLLIASPECTSHSIAKGSKLGYETSRETAFQVVRFAKVLKPRWLVVENVIQMSHWNRYEEWYQQLEAIGYHLQSGVIDARYHGTPQARRRFFVIGDLHRDPVLPRKGKPTKKTIAEILTRDNGEANAWTFSPLQSPGRASATIERANKAVEALGEDKPFIIVYYGSDGAGGFQSLDRPLRTITTIDRFAYVRKNGHGYEMRMLQPPELAAAMGFPKGYLWADCTRRDRIRLIGNAVCPEVMRAVIKSLINEKT
jgi:DNA (cytosine-5)-methyltransferase 1